MVAEEAISCGRNVEGEEVFLPLKESLCNLSSASTLSGCSPTATENESPQNAEIFKMPDLKESKAKESNADACAADVKSKSNHDAFTLPSFKVDSAALQKRKIIPKKVRRLQTAPVCPNYFQQQLKKSGEAEKEELAACDYFAIASTIMPKKTDNDEESFQSCESVSSQETTAAVVSLDSTEEEAAMIATASGIFCCGSRSSSLFSRPSFSWLKLFKWKRSVNH